MAANKKPVKLRFAIMCDSLQFPQWQANVIKKLLSHKNIQCRLLIINQGHSILDKIKRVRPKNFLWFIYSLYLALVSKANQSIDLTPLLSNIPKLPVHTRKKGKHSQYFYSSDIRKIKSHQLDFILRFSFNIIRGDILSSAKYGVWSFHHGDEQKYRGGPPCFWEIYQNSLITAGILQRLTPKLDAGIVLKKGYLKTNHSYIKNRDQMSFVSSDWPTKVCLDILNRQANYLHHPSSTTKAPIYSYPTNLQLIKFLILTTIKQISSLIKTLFWADHWNIGIIPQPIHAFITKPNPKLINWYPRLPQTRFLADPFALVDPQDKTKLHLFYEDFQFTKNKGCISYLAYQNGQFSSPQTIINQLFHLSYPYVFKHHHHYYLLPEASQTNQVVLYQATNFPLKWKKHQILLNNFAGVDNTLIYHHQTWWLFSSNKHSHENSQLYLFYSPNLSQPFTSHPQNPVKTDVRSAKSAGTIYKHKDKLYRPAMNCSEKYGGSITINQILALTKTHYQETKFKAIPYAHTISQVNHFTLIDDHQPIFIFKNPNLIIYNLKKSINKLLQP